ncbi:amino acid ABC transporter permease [Haematobacter massiliensis]|uniref:ABC transporter permease n=1 Tax=Haematobacter massiliensis TaxID=195105 RepID=A0A086Y4X3_9RHOB|nr:amino acid ABC transporter permease [Haematobacter massiliensis]KFI29323.1 ABC transporter permease [Haematobacter massiliensis]OWJ69866.1 amino acid ABC transporter permease [Haematobacter massiliensis]OWJ83686.1 amino acid ABC transporter permease [Haematobacter massiliensis]QBJ25940.1 amino acid ABC transporter permease [Haematobacter massiliensis]
MGNLDFASVLTGEYLDWLLSGLLVTLQLAAGAWALAFGLALVLSVIRATGWKPAELLVAAYVEVHQNIPLLVQMLFWYFAVPELLPEGARMWLNEHSSEFILALFSLGFCFAAYMSEAIRSGLRAVPRTQYEAGRVFGFGYLSTMRYVVVPQALRVAVPPLVNYSLLLFKNTSIAMAIGVHELTYQSRQIESDTFRTFEVFAIATAIYLFFSFVIMAAGTLYERRVSLAAR